MAAAAAANIALAIDYDAKDERENRRWRRGDYPSTADTCFCCGRKAGAHWVAIDMRDTTAVTVEFADQEGGTDTAFFPIGPTCRKAMAIPKTHIITQKKLYR